MTSISLNPIIDPNTGQPYTDQTPHRGDVVSFDIVDLPNRYRNSANLFLQAFQGEVWVWTHINYGKDLNNPVKLDNDDPQYASYPWLAGGEADINAEVRGGNEILATMQFHCLDVR